MIEINIGEVYTVIFRGQLKIPRDVLKISPRICRFSLDEIEAGWGQLRTFFAETLILNSYEILPSKSQILCGKEFEPNFGRPIQISITTCNFG